MTTPEANRETDARITKLMGDKPKKLWSVYVRHDAIIFSDPNMNTESANRLWLDDQNKQGYHKGCFVALQVVHKEYTTKIEDAWPLVDKMGINECCRLIRLMTNDGWKWTFDINRNTPVWAEADTPALAIGRVFIKAMEKT